MSTTTARPRTQGRAPARALLRTELRLLTREPGAMFWVVVFPGLLVALIGLVPAYRENDPDLGGVNVVTLYVPIAILLSALMASLMSMAAVIASYRETQVLRRYSTTPARPWQILGAQAVLHAGAVTVGGVIAILAGVLAYDVSLPGSPLAYLGVYVLALLVNLATGALVAGTSKTAKAAGAIGTALFFPSMFTAGVWLPVAAMPELLRDVVALTPNGAAVLALDDAALGTMPGLDHVVVLVVWTVALGGLAARYFRWE